MKDTGAEKSQNQLSQLQMENGQAQIFTKYCVAFDFKIENPTK